MKQVETVLMVVGWVLVWLCVMGIPAARILLIVTSLCSLLIRWGR